MDIDRLNSISIKNAISELYSVKSVRMFDRKITHPGAGTFDGIKYNVSLNDKSDWTLKDKQKVVERIFDVSGSVDHIYSFDFQEYEKEWDGYRSWDKAVVITKLII